MMMITIGNAAELLGVHTQTLRKWEREGIVIPYRTPGGQRRYDLSTIMQLKGSNNEFKRGVTYCRVSSSKQSADLDRQIKFMQKLFPNNEVISDISSGINFNRSGLRKLLELICTGTLGYIAVSYKDRLARIGFEIFEELAKIYGCEIIVVNNIDTSPEEELVEDIIAITTSFSARMHGLRKYRDKMSNDQNLQKKVNTALENMDEFIHENV